MHTPLSKWRFFRAGGFDQVRLETAQELLSIGSLDQKLWVALSCPVKGIEFDARTLAFIDTDNDGHVRAPDLIAAVQWAGERLAQPEVLAQKLAGVPLAAIRADDETGARIAAAAREVLAANGSAQDGLVTVEAAAAAQAHFAQQAQSAWESAGAAARVAGEGTEAVYAALQAVAAKVDDWFVRCDLAAFDGRAADALNATGDALSALGASALRSDNEGVAALPLARVQAGGALPLDTGINPAWAARVQALRDAAVVPLLGAQSALTAAQWQDLKDRFAPYAAWLAAKPDPAAQGDGVRELEQLARFVRDLMLLANNFVAFKDFYARQGRATFQVGTLYLDGRSAELCVAVNDAGKHAALATLARMCLVYVDCVRGAEKMSVAAAFTAGDSDQLIVGRNGVFYDRQGRDWNATITKIVDHPISLRQAFWAPYKRLARLVSEQLQKIAANKAKEADDRMAVLAVEAAKKGTTAAAPAPAKAAPPAPPTAFDVGKFAGIFAAIGLAVGALGTALASVLTGLLALKWWQLPIALAGMLLVVSGPAVIMAWFKLRSRNLGPILDANGWAINARARINIPFGTSLTQLAQLPANAERALTDPYAEKDTPWGLYAVVLAILVAGLYWGWKSGWLPV
ncbi:hypothetical protein RQP54_00410 [Curvibacter sp. APW13]|uniref:hypothetical protein n=1 Tax=Curvibacter sp. APW13 TaxID=3077236 RepID=UPI0028DF3364|nr:hypothetical protein [Curvibacter sp. APW13]MDT8989316.1 hypothetical protein [Curvibacter sp. APW13]